MARIPVQQPRAVGAKRGVSAKLGRLDADDLLRLVETLPAAVAYVDLEKRVTYANVAFAELVGRDPKSLLGCPLSELYRRSEDVEHAWPKGLTQSVRFEANLRRGGQLFTGETQVSPIPQTEDRAAGYALMVRDIGPDKQVERERQRFRDVLVAERERLEALVDASPLAIMSLDAQGTVRLWSRAAERIFGFSADEALGRFLPTVPEPLRQRFLAQLARVLAGHISPGIETRRQRKDGSFIDVALWPARVRGLDRRFECLAIVADITGRKRLERELRQHMLAVAEQARQKDDFLAMLSHELRNPLTPILASLDLLKAVEGDVDQINRCLSVIDRQARTIGHLVDDLLDVSRIRRGKTHLKKERMDVCGSVFRAVETLREMVDARGLDVHVMAEPGLWIDGDPVRIGQILNNLVQNSIKYTDHGGKLWVSATRECDEVVVRVRDTGIGMPQGFAQKIFDLFEQSEEARARASGGLGIGLSVVRGLVQMHQGTVEARSAGSGTGSEFEVRLPAAEPPEPEPSGRSQVQSNTEAAKMRVLLVDDNVDAATTLSQLIGLWGHEVWTAHDGPSALELARREQPDIVILDIGLPGMDGYETALALRADPKTRNCRLVALTGYSQNADRERAKEVGFAHHLVKPIDAAALKALLAQL